MYHNITLHSEFTLKWCNDIIKSYNNHKSNPCGNNYMKIAVPLTITVNLELRCTMESVCCKALENKVRLRDSLLIAVKMAVFVNNSLLCGIPVIITTKNFVTHFYR